MSADAKDLILKEAAKEFRGRVANLKAHVCTFVILFFKVFTRMSVAKKTSKAKIGEISSPEVDITVRLIE